MPLLFHTGNMAIQENDKCPGSDIVNNEENWLFNTHNLSYQIVGCLNAAAWSITPYALLWSGTSLVGPKYLLLFLFPSLIIYNWVGEKMDILFAPQFLGLSTADSTYFIREVFIPRG